jgi:hypothetical protein
VTGALAVGGAVLLLTVTIGVAAVAFLLPPRRSRQGRRRKNGPR